MRELARVIETLEGLLAPHIGPLMAQASARGQCKALGIDGDGISPEQTEALIERLGWGLAVFVGRPKAAELVQEMRHALAGEAVQEVGP